MNITLCGVFLFDLFITMRFLASFVAQLIFCGCDVTRLHCTLQPLNGAVDIGSLVVHTDPCVINDLSVFVASALHSFGINRNHRAK